MSAFELVHGESLDRHGDVLLLTTGVGKAQVHELDLLVLDHFHDVIGRHCHCRISSGSDYWLEKGEQCVKTADSMPSSMKKQPVVSQRGYRDNLLGRRTKSARSTHYAHRASARRDPAFFATRYKLGILGFLRKPYATPFRQRHSRPRKRTGKADEPALRRSAPSSGSPGTARTSSRSEADRCAQSARMGVCRTRSEFAAGRMEYLSDRPVQSGVRPRA